MTIVGAPERHSFILAMPAKRRRALVATNPIEDERGGTHRRQLKADWG
jgi:hypothetical protein